MDPLTVFAYAKLNLSLDIIGQRSDGYHELRTIMQTITLADELILTPADQICCTASDPSLPVDSRNLAVAAAQAFFKYTEIAQGVHVDIHKRIPSGAGMGGGSSDAAAVLRGLNFMYRAGLSASELCSIGKTVGADVPYCVKGGAALVEGIGEKLTPLPPFMDSWIVVAKPDQSVSTVQAYQKYDQLKEAVHPNTSRLIYALILRDLRAFCSEMRNVMECAVDLPEVEQFEQIMLMHGALGSCMTGSGSAVFGVFASKEKAQACAHTFQRQIDTVFLCQPIQPENLS